MRIERPLASTAGGGRRRPLPPVSTTLLLAVLGLARALAATAAPPPRPATAATPPPRPEAVVWVERIGMCDNAEEVAAQVFGDGEVWALASWEVLDTDDGATLLLAVPNEGAGTCHGVTARLFDVADRRCRLVLELGVDPQVVDGPQVDGRAMIEAFSCETDWPRVLFEDSFFFWSGDGYEPAFREEGWIEDQQRVIEHRWWYGDTRRDFWHARGIEARIRALFALDARTAWAGGGLRREGLDSEGPALFHTVDGGATWRFVDTGAAGGAAVVSIFFLDPSHGWLALAADAEGGGDPEVLRTEDGGETWSRSRIELPIPPAPSVGFSPGSIEFATPEVGLLHTSHVVVEDEMAVFVTTDGGATWHYSHGLGAKGASSSDQRLSRARDASLWKLGGYCERCDPDAVFISHDDGLTWRQTATRPVDAP